MLQITIPKNSIFNEKTREIFAVPETVLSLEHSLLSIKKWESKWEKPFLSEDRKTEEQTRDYIRCMTVHPKNVDPLVYFSITSENAKTISNYIDSRQTATTITEDPSYQKGKKQILTAELIYCYMVEFGIPFECEKWNLNQLLTLIRVCNVRSQPSKKMNPGDVARKYGALNKSRRGKLGSMG